MSANLSGVIDRLRSGTCWFTASNAEPLHHDHHKTGASPPNRTASSCSSGRRADHLRQRGNDCWHPARESNSHQEIWKLLCCHYTSGALLCGGRPWSRTRNVCHKGPGLQPGGAHAIAPRRPYIFGQGGWARTSDLLVPSEARYQLRHTLTGSGIGSRTRYLRLMRPE